MNLPTLFVGAALAFTATLPARAAEPWPDKPITLVVPTAPAGGTDVVARIFAQRLGKALGQPVIIENRAGANGMLGLQSVARAKPDGYTLVFAYAAALVANPSLYKNVPFDPVKDFEPIVQIGRAGNMLLVRSDFPAKTAKEYVAYVKSQAGKLNYCSWGIGSGGHLAMESLNKQAGLSINHVPYKGGAACVQDLIGGQVQAAFGDISTNLPFLKAGKLRGILYAGPSRLQLLPEVPTMNELGYAFTTYSWYGLLAPAHTPAAVITRMNAEVNKLLLDPELKARLAELNLEDLPPSTSERFAKQIQLDIAGWAKLIHDNNIQLD